MNARDAAELTPQERAAIVTHYLNRHHAIQTATVCELTGLGMNGAYYLMNRLSRVLPIYNDGDKWRLIHHNGME